MNIFNLRLIQVKLRKIINKGLIFIMQKKIYFFFHLTQLLINNYYIFIILGVEDINC